SQDHRHREDTTVDQHEWCGLRVSIGLLNVVGRATAVLTRILVLLLVDLRQRTLNARGSRAYKRNRPHPNDCAWSTESNCRSNTSNIADPHASCQRHHQRLERGHSILGLLTMAKLLEHVRKPADLEEFRGQGDVNSSCQTQEN